MRLHNHRAIIIEGSVCPVCGVDRGSEDRLRDHLELVHPDRIGAPPPDNSGNLAALRALRAAVWGDKE